MDSNPDLRAIPDDQLLAQCRWEAFRGPGPGGQKRNKTSSAVRITHLPTGLSAIAAELRSQHQNRSNAFRRLRHRLALEIRQTVDWPAFTPPPWFSQLLEGPGLLGVSLRSPQYLPVMGLLLDVLAAAGGSISAAAQALGLTTANLIKFFQRDRHLWAKVNQMRLAHNLKPLTPSRD